MNDPADRILQERLHALAQRVGVPVVSSTEDLRRGRRRLLGVRVAMAGATAGTLGVVLGVTSLTAGNPRAVEAPLFTSPSTSLSSAPSLGGTPETDGPSSAGSTSGEPGRSGEPDGASGEANSGSSTAQTGDHARGVKVPPPQPGDGSTGASAEDSRGATGGTATGGGAGGSHPDGNGAVVPPAQSATQTTDHSPTQSPPQSPSLPAVPTAPAGTPAGAPTGPSAGPTSPPTSPSTSPSTPTTRPPASSPSRGSRLARQYYRALAAHLDPEREHLRLSRPGRDTVRTVRVGGRVYAAEVTYRWREARPASGPVARPGAPSTRVVVKVATGWDQVRWHCGATYAEWQCRDAATRDGRPAEVAIRDGLLSVAVERAGGQVVVITVDQAFRTPGAATESAVVTALATAAADRRLVVPGRTVPVAPPRIDPDEFAEAGAAALVSGAGESFQQTSLDRVPSVRGVRWVGETASGRLGWSARPSYSAESFACLSTYRACTSVTVGDNGAVVHLAFLRGRAGGWIAQYDGPSYVVGVYSSTRTLPKQRAFAFITRADWQPAR